MNSNTMFIGKSKMNMAGKPVKGEFITIDNELFYKITNHNHMNPFFMSIVSDSDHWLFIWSNGALSAGRKNPEHVLFPYYTDDKILDSADITGSKTIVLVNKDEKTCLWEPFSEKYAGLYDIERNIYKNFFGNKILFEEVNVDLGISFQYSWCNSDKFGFVKHSTIINKNDADVKIRILDGVQNILPYGVEQKLQEQYSTLADGYKKNELDAASGLGMYMLSSIPVDKAEPSEALKATTVWSYGLENSVKLLSANQLYRFRKSMYVEQELDIKALRGAYFDCTEFDLSQNEKKDWYLVAEVDQDAADVVNLQYLLRSGQNLATMVNNDIVAGTDALAKIVANADGLQMTADRLSVARHYSNVLFNVMRGGIFEDNYHVRKADLISFLKFANENVLNNHNETLDTLADELNYIELLNWSVNAQDPNLERLIYEYLPLTFSRRHGDPSRPWNQFSIDLKDENSSPLLSYQGNWRDIFQNWEALGLSFPGYVESMISKFLNASTVDGYNPYRITRDGIDWEVIDPADPWSNIGYWGDHQIIYMLKLLELSKQFHPGKLEELLTRNVFSYANVPYRIKPYEDLLEDPKVTIDFDDSLENMIQERVGKIGSDGRLFWDNKDQVYHVNLMEKLLASVLSKFTNFIPEAGIWLNTQRPEWNDANNALVGFGVSMVTLYYMRRFQLFFLDLVDNSGIDKYEISEEIYVLFNSIKYTFAANKDKLQSPVSDLERRKIMDELGSAGSTYRNSVYNNGFSGIKKELSSMDLTDFITLSMDYIDHSIKANKRDDHLYHSYNLMKIEKDGSVSIRYLYEMLEGQVAVLSSRYLGGQESLELLSALKASSLYREDQNSYILYPNRTLSRFMEKNNISSEDLKKSLLFQRLISDENKDIIVLDVEGGAHFSGNMRNGDVLKEAMEGLKSQAYSDFPEQEWQFISDVYEKIFDHQSFTGRSGTFYKFEGLGSIYWHMVSKLLLAVQETFYSFIDNNDDEVIAGKLIECYYDIRAGIGLNKTPDNYGAFPMDPYSHTPIHLGAQQPGMTGQVKEDVLSRFGELGIGVRNGSISFYPVLLRREEFLTEASNFNYYSIEAKAQSIDIQPNCLAFTFIQVPVVYHISDEEHIVVTKAGNEKQTIIGQTLDEKTSASIFTRYGEVQQIDVFFNPTIH